jgi:DNA-binding transcriptional ArsR family regulator
MKDSSYKRDPPPPRNGFHLVDPEAVAAAEGVLCGEQELTLIADTFQILANATRLQIVRALAGRELCVGDLAAAVGASPSAVSHHLRQLRQMRLVRYRRDGKLTYYSLDDEHVAQLFDLGLQHVREELE